MIGSDFNGSVGNIQGFFGVKDIYKSEKSFLSANVHFIMILSNEVTQSTTSRGKNYASALPRVQCWVSATTC